MKYEYSDSDSFNKNVNSFKFYETSLVCIQVFLILLQVALITFFSHFYAYNIFLLYMLLILFLYLILQRLDTSKNVMW